MKRRVRSASLVVLACGLAGGCSAQREREATLKQNLVMMRQAIDNYTLGKERAPQSLSHGPVHAEKRLGPGIY